MKLQAPGGPIVDSFNVYIRPWIHKRLSPAAAVLPDLRLSTDSQLDFPAALEDFLAWCGEDRVFASWGSSDLAVLLQNQEYWKLKARLPETYVDLQRAFGRVMGASENLSLEWCAEYCGVPDIFDPHNALADAVYAACVGCLLTREEMDEAVRPARGEGKIQKYLPHRAAPWQGPFETPERALNNRGCRRGQCPTCRAFVRVARWYRGRDRRYYSRFSCPQCGRRYILRLELTTDWKKRLWANTAVAPAPGEMDAACQAAERTPPVPCRGKRRHRPRRRGKKPTTQPASPASPASPAE